VEINYNYEIRAPKSENIVLYGKNGNLLISGILNGSLVVKAPAIAQITGIMNGDLIIEDGASVELRGILNAKAIQNSGRFDVYGIISCVSGIPDTATLNAGCVVNGIKH